MKKILILLVISNLFAFANVPGKWSGWKALLPNIYYRHYVLSAGKLRDICNIKIQVKNDSLEDKKLMFGIKYYAKIRGKTFHAKKSVQTGEWQNLPAQSSKTLFYKLDYGSLLDTTGLSYLSANYNNCLNGSVLNIQIKNFRENSQKFVMELD